jgi:hypothetical protein
MRYIKNAILFYATDTFRLTGSTINAIEYYLAAYEYNKDVKLVLSNASMSFRRKIWELIEDRYKMDDYDWMKNITFASLPYTKFGTALVVDYMTIYKTRGLVNADKILVISEKYTDNPEYFYSKDLYNVEYYGEMPFHYKDHDYRMKCLFNRYKPLKEVKTGTYLNSPRNDNNIYNLSRELGKEYIHLPMPFIYKSKTKPEENLFEKFTDYVYYHANKWFDPHPRLFLECAFYDKSITYINQHEMKDGSWYRYNDIQKNGLHRRTLDATDEIIAQLI